MGQAGLRFASLSLLLSGCGPEWPDCHSPGQICTVAGTGQAGFNGDGQLGSVSWLYWPSAVSLDPEGRLVLVDFNNVRIRRLEHGRLFTIAGNGVHGWSLPGAPVLESPLENPIDIAWGDDGAWYIAALHEARVLRVADGTVTPYAGRGDLGFDGDGGPAIEAAMSEMTGIETGPDGELYIADTGNHCLRMVRADGVIETLGGYGLPGYAGDGGDVSDALFSSPGRLHRDGEWLYVADSGNHMIRRIHLENHTIEPFAGSGVPGYGGDGGAAASAQLTLPGGVATTPDGTVLIADAGNHVVRAVSPDGTISTVAGNGELADPGADTPEAVPATDVALSWPADVVADDTAFWFADSQASRVRRVALP